MKRLTFFISAVFFALSVFAETKIKHNPWELIIYRPENAQKMNEVRCWLKIEDLEGNDVTYTAAKATYEWISIPDKVNHYERTYYLMGGMAMHLQNIKPGKYKFTFTTPQDKQYPYEEKKGDWTSNEFIYDTENSAKVIFVYPTAGDSGFYDGGWIISGKAPEYFKFTKPGSKQ